jgi:hypothetical protein
MTYKKLINDVSSICINESKVPSQMEPTKKNIFQMMVMGGFNEKDAKKAVDEFYDYVSKTYPDSGLAKRKEIVMYLWSASK